MTTNLTDEQHAEWHKRHEAIMDIAERLMGELLDTFPGVPPLEESRRSMAHFFAVGNFGDDLWEWMRHHLPELGGLGCDWADCDHGRGEVAEQVA